MQVVAFKTPCHTKGHVCYYVSHPGDVNRILLTGDTLFIAGCGKFFEGVHFLYFTYNIWSLNFHMKLYFFLVRINSPAFRTLTISTYVLRVR